MKTNFLKEAITPDIFLESITEDSCPQKNIPLLFWMFYRYKIRDFTVNLFQERKDLQAAITPDMLVVSLKSSRHRSIPLLFWMFYCHRNRQFAIGLLEERKELRDAITPDMLSVSLNSGDEKDITLLFWMLYFANSRTFVVNLLKERERFTKCTYTRYGNKVNRYCKQATRF